MDKFRYKACDKEGKTLTGVVEAKDEKQAAKLLRARDLLVISLHPQGVSFLAQMKTIRRVGAEEKVNFTRQLATMFNAGLPLTEALSLLESQASPAMSKVIGEVLDMVEGGKSLADALERHPQVFDQVYIALVRAGEAAGVLDKVLERLAQNLETQRDFQTKVRGAMIYPIIIITGMVVVSLVMIVFVIPRLTVLYEEFEAELPAITKFLVSFSKFLSSFWWLFILMVVGFIYSLRLLPHHPALKKKYDELYFRIPVLGNLRRQMMLTEFSRTLGLLLASGILVVDALNIVKDSLGSPIYAEALAEAARRVEKGFPLATALAQTEIFPYLLPQMVAVGEETGKIDEVLEKISAYFEQQVEVLIKGLTTALEPFILILLGIGVGFLILAVVMPIYNLTSQF